MDSRFPQNSIFPDEETLQAWENMRIEILHELQEGTIADVPHSEVDALGSLVVELEYWRARKKLRSEIWVEVFRSAIILPRNFGITI